MLLLCKYFLSFNFLFMKLWKNWVDKVKWSIEINAYFYPFGSFCLIVYVFCNRPTLEQQRRINLCSTVFQICSFSTINFCQINAMIIESKIWSYCLLPSVALPPNPVLLSGLELLILHILPLLFQRSENTTYIYEKSTFPTKINQSQGNYKIEIFSEHL